MKFSILLMLCSFASLAQNNSSLLSVEPSWFYKIQELSIETAKEGKYPKILTKTDLSKKLQVNEDEILILGSRKILIANMRAEKALEKLSPKSQWLIPPIKSISNLSHGYGTENEMSFNSILETSATFIVTVNYKYVCKSYFKSQKVSEMIYQVYYKQSNCKDLEGDDSLYKSSEQKIEIHQKGTDLILIINNAVLSKKPSMASNKVIAKLANERGLETIQAIEKILKK